MEAGGEESSSKKSRVKVLMVPWLAHGHISPFLELGKRLTERNCTVYICSTKANLISIEGRIKPPHASSIHLLELLLPPTPDLPPHLHTTNALPSSLTPSLIHSFQMAAPSFSEILHSLHPHLLIFDIFQPWLPPLAASIGVPSCLFLTCSAAAAAFFIHHRLSLPSPFPFPSVFLRGHELPGTYSIFNPGGSPAVMTIIDGSYDLVLIRASLHIEREKIEYLETLMHKKIVSLGSLFQRNLLIHPQVEEREMREWLGEKEEASVAYMSFGTEYFPSGEDIEEMAWGLEMSGVNFIWVLRFPAGEERGVPEGFMERVEGRGVVVKWASQKEILQHRSVGCVVSHCGWGSLMEAMYSGVPIVGLPIRGDQPLNCRLIVEIGAGVEGGRDEAGRLHRGRLAEVIRDVVVGELGRGMRRKNREIQELLRREEFDNALRQISGAIGKDI